MKKIKIHRSTVFSRNDKDFLITEVDGESVMMHVSNGQYWGLNTTSTEIWNYLEANKSLEELIQYMMSIYDVEEESCHAEVGTVVIAMVKNKILFVQENKEGQTS